MQSFDWLTLHSTCVTHPTQRISKSQLEKSIKWQKFPTSLHHAWMCHQEMYRFLAPAMLSFEKKYDFVTDRKHLIHICFMDFGRLHWCLWNIYCLCQSSLNWVTCHTINSQRSLELINNVCVYPVLERDNLLKLIFQTSRVSVPVELSRVCWSDNLTEHVFQIVGAKHTLQSPDMCTQLSQALKASLPGTLTLRFPWIVSINHRQNVFWMY